MPSGSGPSKQPGQAVAEEEIKNEIVPKGVGFLTPVPYGNEQVAYSKADVANIKKFWTETLESDEEQRRWPTNLMSFESWCAMTCYDTSVANGGPAFQKLMLQLLGANAAQSLTVEPSVHDRKLSPKNPPDADYDTTYWYKTLDFDHFWHPDAKGLDCYGPMFE